MEALVIVSISGLTSSGEPKATLTIHTKAGQLGSSSEFTLPATDAPSAKAALLPQIMSELDAADIDVSDPRLIHIVTPFDESRATILGMKKCDFSLANQDQAIAIACARYRITEVLVCNPSAGLGIAAGGVYTGSGRTGTAVVPATQAYLAVTGSGKLLSTTLAAATLTDHFTASELYLNLLTGKATQAFADVMVFGQAIH